jgi:hypothetical protein
MAGSSHNSAHISSHTLQIGNFLDHKQMITSLITIAKIMAGECSRPGWCVRWRRWIHKSWATTTKNVSRNDKENWISLRILSTQSRKFPSKSGMNCCTINFKLSYHLGAFVPRILFSCEICRGPALHQRKECAREALKVPRGKLTFIPHVKLNLFSWENWKSFLLCFCCIGRVRERERDKKGKLFSQLFILWQ